MKHGPLPMEDWQPDIRSLGTPRYDAILSRSGMVMEWLVFSISRSSRMLIWTAGAISFWRAPFVRSSRSSLITLPFGTTFFIASSSLSGANIAESWPSWRQAIGTRAAERHENRGMPLFWL